MVTLLTSPHFLLSFGVSTWRFRAQNICSPEENACTAGYQSAYSVVMQWCAPQQKLSSSKCWPKVSIIYGICQIRGMKCAFLMARGDVFYVCLITSVFALAKEGRSVSVWSGRRTRNPAVSSSSTALATCWIFSRSSRVEILGHACKQPTGCPPTSWILNLTCSFEFQVCFIFPEKPQKGRA